jgi:hypothetical protein
MADFTIVAPEPFVVEGADGATYELPRLKDLNAQQVVELGAVTDDTDDMKQRIEAVRGFILSLCPDIADEPITDMGYMQLFTALAEGSGITLGEF